MRGRFTLRRLITIAALTGAWCALWQALSVANVLSGAVIAIGVTALGVGTPGRGGIRLVPLLRLAWLVLVDLVASTINVAHEILTPMDHTDEGIVAVRLPADGREHLLLLIVAITLTPGTAVVDADPDNGVLYLHLLHAGKRAEVERHVHRLAELTCLALPHRSTGVEAGA